MKALFLFHWKKEEKEERKKIDDICFSPKASYIS